MDENQNITIYAIYLYIDGIYISMYQKLGQLLKKLSQDNLNLVSVKNYFRVWN